MFPMSTLKRREIISFIFLAVLLSFSGCGRKSDVSKPAKITKDASKTIQKAGVPLYPKSRYLRDNTDTQEYLRPTPIGLNPENIKTTEIWIAAPGSFAEVQSYYQKLYPHVITERKQGDKTVFLQLSNVGDLKKAGEDKTSPVILIDLRDSTLSPGEKAAFQNELASLKSSKVKDAVADRRIEQLEGVLQENPLVKVNIREVSDVPKAA